MNIERCIDDLLIRGVDDWVHTPEVEWVAKSTGGASTPDQILDLSLHLIREVVQQNLMEIGDVTESDRGFRKWGLSKEEAMQRVEREWKALGRNPNLGEICWLCNTEKGNERGERLLRQRKPCG